MRVRLVYMDQQKEKLVKAATVDGITGSCLNIAGFLRPDTLEPSLREIVQRLSVHCVLLFDSPGFIEFVPDLFENNKCLQSVLVPSSVRTIGDSCFHGCTCLKQVSFSRGSVVTEFGRHAFFNTSLQTLCVPASLQHIGEYCFRDCASLSFISFPPDSQLASIGTEAFAHAGIESMHLPATLCEIGESAFFNCPIITFTISESNPHFYTDQVMIYDKHAQSVKTVAQTRHAYFLDREIKTVAEGCFSIPITCLISFPPDAQVTCFETDAFAHSAIRVFHLPDSVETISSLAFGACFVLEEVVISNNSHLHTIERMAFRFCLQLTTIHIPPALASIGESAFERCNTTYLTISPENTHFAYAHGILYDKTTHTAVAFTLLSEPNPHIPPDIEVIASNCFARFSTITSVTFPVDSALTIIGPHAFTTTLITSITIPAHVTVIETHAFYGCRSLSTLEFQPTSSIGSIKSSAFSHTNLSQLEFPASLEIIGEAAFECCPSLAFIHFAVGSKITFIDDRAFHATAVAFVNLPNSQVIVSPGAFPVTCTVYPF